MSKEKSNTPSKPSNPYKPNNDGARISQKSSNKK